MWLPLPPILRVFRLCLLCWLGVGGVQAFTQRSWEEAYSLANETVQQLTQAEKLGLVIGVGEWSSRCVGNITPPSRSITLSSTTLTIPPICFNDGPAGVRLVKEVTGFPTGINAASTFSRRLMRARGVALAEEFRGKGVHVLLGPAMDIMRNPKAGRGWESAGPDPYLNGEFAYETIVGIQSVGVQACAKHFIANNQEHWRYGLSADVDDRTLHEIYWWPFMRSIDANVSSVLCAYNRFNQTSSCHNEALIGSNGLLRQGGFQGYVVSDWGATHDSASDNANAGLDMEQPGDFLLIGGGVYGNGGLNNAVNDGDVSVTTLNEMVVRVLASFLRLGQDSDYPAINFDAQEPDGSGDLNLGISVRSEAHTALTREIGAASAVLLKNDRTTTTGSDSGVTVRGLPVAQERIKTIAIVGQDAKMPNLDCNSLGECNDGTMSVGWGSGTNSLQYIVPPIDAITEFVGNSATITSSLSNDLSAGPAAAKGKDLAIVFANAMSGELGAYDIVDGNMGDRNDLDLWYKGGSLIEDVAAVCNNTVVVVHSVGPVYLEWSTHENISALIYAGAPGEQTGPSLVDIIWGAVNPSGRLPFSIAYDEDAYGTEIVYNSLGFPTITYTEKLLLDYRYMNEQGIAPQFEFGFGLSFTTFSYSSLSIASSGGSKVISFNIANTGAFNGTEIPQMYLGFPDSAGETEKVLRGFDEVILAVGEMRTVSMSISQKEMSIWDVPSQSWVKPSGTFTVYVGASIKDIRLTGSF
ncbi:glycoside hydrolase family 3 protein [Guyanagaster necrorhizus]|uniref:beta-glucosidase n=1 Tax=Guyanagaster necrorhizus TaxID=856835 RepID=A0A9P8AV80_9AGAR|nr:glycoside hydrolase family 3 protein [Guyanagaster necrorhizus MCA 3950]KAG7447637.1 glycoside hydrolase family 3 protein [Guyanagaster necrorhizus MCA 3950]